MPARMTQEEFVQKAQLKHINEDGEPLYDYSITEYKASMEKIYYICKIHGKIKEPQRACTHLRGAGCQECGKLKAKEASQIGAQRKNQEARDKFVAQANKIHDNKYDYSQSTYIKALVKVKIICPIHGAFEQMPASHLDGKGCNKCGFDEMASKRRMSLEDFIKKANEKHGDKYNYSKIDKYIRNSSPVLIECPVPGHPPFLQAPTQHLFGQGCPRCGDRRVTEARSNDLTNHRFGRLLVLRKAYRDTGEFQRKGGGQPYWVKCDCGSPEYITTNGSLTIAGIKSCKYCKENGGDSIERFRQDPDYANLQCFLYVADIDDMYVKVGITNDLIGRKRQGKYNSYYSYWKLIRCEARAIEQNLLWETLDAQPDIDAPIGDKRGVSEWRIRAVKDARWFVDRYHELLEEMHEIGWDALYCKIFENR